MKKVILYGIRGLLRKEIEQYLSDEYEIIGYSDSAAEYQHCRWIDFKQFFSKKVLKTIEFDYCIITTKTRETAKEIKDMLLSEGVDKNKILEYALFNGVQYPHPYEMWGGTSISFLLPAIF